MATPETAAVVIPPFIQRDPALWFYMIESTFELPSPKPITESKTKYNYAVSHLPPDIATVVRDVIIQPDISDPYSELKAKIIERCSENKTQEIRRLLAGESLGDRKPSELLRIMKRRAENHNIDDSLLFELFNQAMPVQAMPFWHPYLRLLRTRHLRWRIEFLLFLRTQSTLFLQVEQAPHQ
ncbi:uncharacterized protein TNCV_1973521 [Trichonephila clavipes]|nr:uncharacterized protein TNCV_1973521 [Trichonephila clavipes]